MLAGIRSSEPLGQGLEMFACLLVVNGPMSAGGQGQFPGSGEVAKHLTKFVVGTR